MTDTPASDLYSTLAEIIRSNNSPAMQKAREAIAYRVALSGDVAPSRIPAPRNITEIGGYLNLLQKLQQPDLTTQALAATLGVAGPVSSLFDPAVTLSLFFREVPNDRPGGAQQATYPLSYWIRSDFADPLAAALATLRTFGASLPMLMLAPTLPTTVTGEIAADQTLAVIGRRLRIAPTAALIDVATDPVLIARKEDAADWRVMARVLDTAAPRAGEAESGRWQCWQCNVASCSEVTLDDATLVDVAPVLAQAGWFKRAPVAQPVSLPNALGWNRFDNITGLVPAKTRLGDELFRAFDRAAIAGSSLAALVDRLWDGASFA